MLTHGIIAWLTIFIYLENNWYSDHITTGLNNIYFPVFFWFRWHFLLAVWISRYNRIWLIVNWIEGSVNYSGFVLLLCLFCSSNAQVHPIPATVKLQYVSCLKKGYILNGRYRKWEKKYISCFSRMSGETTNSMFVINKDRLLIIQQLKLREGKLLF